ncbi:glycoside hydrolase family protein [Flavivirga rizhaonensis]|uniref:Iota-carrageenase A2 n=1 Tax=Flavivirga rizhaonensis TaxID=2559571 RepID=A0A4S1DU90_9FLAO|nr:hypothetical protein [Flavivirga rizhaonensis]TGV01577.1 hypothetical protein EM932_14955 [Flavivirga rizhaonensis]
MIKHLLPILCFAILLSSCSENALEPETTNDEALIKSSDTSKYSDPNGRANLPNENISPVNGNDTGIVQAAIDRATAKNTNGRPGGRVTLKKGTYQLEGVVLKSNVHIEIEKGTRIVPQLRSRGSSNIFLLGRDGIEIKNVSIRGKGGKFTVKYPPNTNTIVNGRGVRSFILGKVSNFLLKDFNVIDRYTKFSVVACITTGTTDNDRPRNGTFENISVQNLSHGYGVVQVNAGANLVLRNLKSTGGVAARIETDLHDNIINQIGVDNISIFNVQTTDGYTPLLMNPHAIHNGRVTADNVKAMRCEFAVLIRDGFVAKDIPADGLTPGSFAQGSKVTRINAVYGDNVPSHPKNNKYRPFSLRSEFAESSGEADPGISHRGPSITAVGNFAGDEVTVLESEVTHSGYKVGEHVKITTKPVTR